MFNFQSNSNLLSILLIFSTKITFFPLSILEKYSFSDSCCSVIKGFKCKIEHIFNRITYKYFCCCKQIPIWNRTLVDYFSGNYLQINWEGRRKEDEKSDVSIFIFAHFTDFRNHLWRHLYSEHLLSEQLLSEFCLPTAPTVTIQSGKSDESDRNIPPSFKINSFNVLTHQSFDGRGREKLIGPFRFTKMQRGIYSRSVKEALMLNPHQRLQQDHHLI